MMHRPDVNSSDSLAISIRTNRLGVVPYGHTTIAPQEIRRMFGGAVVAGWIVRDACARVRSEIGTYRWDQWRQAANALGISVVIVNTGPIPPACIVDDLIIIRSGFDAQTTAFLCWHELGHACLHAGNRDVWAARPFGKLIVGKMERQANEFAELFPVWE